ncbi:hypothetical protein KIH41_17430 [Litoribacter ruber]|uniref:hypothetical protein n=1 Tax=Litoribacter ruber TaxID=702568 RepID=UPI001BDA62C7|nr:hypothetical protein [Litoribacter ruber]MBT0813074.1 hypothetical protein [Litoribacter ruber]
MKINVILIGLILFFSYSCESKKIVLNSGDIVSVYEIEKLEYDTLRGYFLFESYIEAYIQGGDGVIKGGGFLKGKEVDQNSYSNGYYICDLNILNKYNINNKEVKYNFESVSLLKKHLNQIFWTHPGFSKKDYSPYCGVFFRPFFLEVVVLKIGQSRMDVPKLEICPNNSYKAELESLEIPSFLIVDVTCWEELHVDDI